MTKYDTGIACSLPYT